MGFEPQKLLIGLVDFFAVLLPGALFTFLFADTAGPLLMGNRYATLAGSSREAAFVLVSYLTGHFVFLIGSLVLDGFCYDPFRNATKIGQIRRLAVSASKVPRQPGRIRRALLHHLKFADCDIPLRQAELLKKRELGRLGAGSAMNTFQWAKISLSLSGTDAATDVHRFEADSKFFRSLVVVLSCWAAWSAGHLWWKPAIFSIVLGACAFVRYIEQRMKATRQAYWAVLARHATDPASTPLWIAPQAPATTHAGGVVFRCVDDVVEVLLVSSTAAPNELVLPKGHIESGETEAETAVREVLEESGLWAKVIGPDHRVQFGSMPDNYGVAFFAMNFVAEAHGTRPEDRSSKWVNPSDIRANAAYVETAEIVEWFLNDPTYYKRIAAAIRADVQ
jgi:8-oxo-dGTP pyrophosphatase MutT (NUDIX family)